jgi:SAM-dependent methyltransferase
MHMNCPAAEQRRLLREWFDTPLGRSLQAQESNRLREVLPSLYGTVAVQLGRIGRLDMFEACVAPSRALLDPRPESDGVVVCGVPEALPFDTKSVDVALLPHTLDFCDDPHQVLREVNRVLAPEGHVVVLGFNPLSLWGVRRLFARAPRALPWSGHFIRLARLKDWLRLLDFELTQGQMLFYRPPLLREGMMDRLFFLDKMGDRWWPMMAGVYLLVARKRVIGMTPIKPSWKLKPAASAVARGATARGVVVQMGEWRKRTFG